MFQSNFRVMHVFLTLHLSLANSFYFPFAWFNLQFMNETVLTDINFKRIKMKAKETKMGLEEKVQGFINWTMSLESEIY